jgi:hypothetical protein
MRLRAKVLPPHTDAIAQKAIERLGVNRFLKSITYFFILQYNNLAQLTPVSLAQTSDKTRTM